MRWTHFLLLQCLLIAAVGALMLFHQDKVVVLKKPPEELAQWYKPDNKRQVWLHTMFNLRREMQAVGQYAEASDAERLASWSDKLAEHYLDVGKMVPSWQRKLDIVALEQLQQQVEQQQFGAIAPTLERLQQSCDSCHQDFRTQTALLYRAPDFSDIDTGEDPELNQQMQSLISQVNRIKIAMSDGMPEQALPTLEELNQGMAQLGQTCLSCHKQQRQEYPSAEIRQTSETLEQALTDGTLKQQGRALGTLAVQACAQCHAIHRQGFDMRELLQQGSDWQGLVRH